PRPGLRFPARRGGHVPSARPHGAPARQRTPSVEPPDAAALALAVFQRRRPAVVFPARPSAARALGRMRRAHSAYTAPAGCRPSDVTGISHPGAAVPREIAVIST